MEIPVKFFNMIIIVSCVLLGMASGLFLFAETGNAYDIYQKAMKQQESEKSLLMIHTDKANGLEITLYKKMKSDGFVLRRQEIRLVKDNRLFSIQHVSNREGHWMICNSINEAARQPEDEVAIEYLGARNLDSAPIKDPEDFLLEAKDTTSDRGFFLIKRTLDAGQRKDPYIKGKTLLDGIKDKLGEKIYSTHLSWISDAAAPVGCIYKIGMEDYHIYDVKYYNKSGRVVRSHYLEHEHYETMDDIEDDFFEIPSNYKLHLPLDTKEAVKITTETGRRESDENSRKLRQRILKK